MDERSQWYEEMERYLQGEMSENEEREFEDRLQRDQTMASEFTAYKELREGLSQKWSREDASVAMKGVLAKHDKLYQDRQRRRRMIAWILVVLTAIMAYLLFFDRSSPLSVMPDSGPCFDYDFTDGTLDTTIWEVVDVTNAAYYAQSDGYLKMGTGQAGGQITMQIKGMMFSGDLEGIIELGNVITADDFGRQIVFTFDVNGNNQWQVPETSHQIARNRLQFEQNNRDLITDHVGQWSPIRKFYHFERLSDTFKLSHADFRDGPYTEMQQFVDPDFPKEFRHFEMYVSVNVDMGPVEYEIGRITIFKGCVRNKGR